MEKSQRTTLWLLVIIGTVYFFALIPANLTGAQTPDMLAVFEVDEYAQYEHVIRMLTPGETLYQSLRNFVVYLHYFYGYPFYFLSAVSLVPYKLLAGTNWIENSRLIMCILRQMISVLPMILSCGIAVWLATRFKRRVASLALFVFLLTLPAVLINDFWWHTDSVQLLFIFMTFFFLDIDHLRFGRWFIVAAAACGVAVGTKYLGLYFGLAVPLYLLEGFWTRHLTMRQVFTKALLFVFVMLLFVVVVNPLLMLPQERAEIIRTQRQLLNETSTGIFLVRDNPFWQEGNLPKVVRQNFAESWFFVLALLILVINCFCGTAEKKVKARVLAAYVLLAGTVTLTSDSRRIHYFLPLIIPLFSILPMAETLLPPRVDARRKRAFSILCLLLLMLQLIPNLITDVDLTNAQLMREELSPSLRFYEILQNEVVPKIEQDPNRVFRVLRDWKVYYPQQANTIVQMEWDMLTSQRVSEFSPDLLLVEQVNIEAYADASVLENAVNLDQMQGMHDFYQMAAQNNIPGYSMVYEDNFARAFVSLKK